MMTLRRAFLVGATLWGAAACGPLNEGSAATGFLSAVQARFAGNGAAAASATPVLTRAQADANPGAFLLVTAYGGGSVAAMVPASSTSRGTTWLSADNVSLTENNGIIISTRGFPRDLMAADISGTIRALVAEGGSAQRVHEYLNDSDGISTELLRCSIASAGRETVEILGKRTGTERFDEACEGESAVFTNNYWISDAGRIIKSRQAVSVETGYLTLERP